MIRYWLGLVIWGAGLVFIWWLSKGDWQVVSAVATWFLVLGVAYAFLQVQQARRSTNAQLAVQLYTELRDKNVLDTRHKVYELMPDDITRLLSSKEKEDEKQNNEIVEVLNKLELLGVLVAKGIIDERLAIETYGGAPVLKCWHQLGKNYIKEKRKQRGLFCKYVEDLAKRTVKYQLKRAPKDEWIHFLKEIPLRRDDDRVNLIETLKGELLSGRERFWSWFIRYLNCIFKPSLR